MRSVGALRPSDRKLSLPGPGDGLDRRAVLRAPEQARLDNNREEPR